SASCAKGRKLIRCQKFWVLKYELKKQIISKERKGIFISTAGSGSDAIFDCSRKTVKALFDVLNIKYDRDFTYNNIDFKGDILKIPQALEEVFGYGKNLII
ncbi:MAG: hypothetical protein WCJ54_07685, partial [Actinomycetota bacterium]